MVVGRRCGELGFCGGGGVVGPFLARVRAFQIRMPSGGVYRTMVDDAYDVESTVDAAVGAVTFGVCLIIIIIIASLASVRI